MHKWHDKKIADSAKNKSAGGRIMNAMLTEERTQGSQNIRAWEDQVLGTVFAVHRRILLPRYKARWQAASDAAYIKAFASDDGGESKAE